MNVAHDNMIDFVSPVVNEDIQPVFCAFACNIFLMMFLIALLSTSIQESFGCCRVALILPVMSEGPKLYFRWKGQGFRNTVHYRLSQRSRIMLQIIYKGLELCNWLSSKMLNCRILLLELYLLLRVEDLELGDR